MVSPSKFDLDRAHSTAIAFRVVFVVVVLTPVAALLNVRSAAPYPAAASRPAAARPQRPQIFFEDVQADSGIRYRNVSGDPSKRYIMSSLGSGACLFDFDQDGRLDLYLANGGPLRGSVPVPAAGNVLYRNLGGWHFADVTDRGGADAVAWSLGCAVGDIDNDGFDDLFVSNIGENLLFRNQGDGTFTLTPLPSGPRGDLFSTSGAFFDGDGDGYLDLYVTNYVGGDLGALPPASACGTWLGLSVFCGPRGLEAAPDAYYRNRGDGSFTDATAAAGFGAVEAAFGLGIVVGDYDDDGDIDVYVANDAMPNYLFENDGTGHFTEVALFTGTAYNAAGLAQAGMGVDMGDIDGDGRLDMFVTNFSHDTNTPYLNLGNGLFADATDRAGLRASTWFNVGWATRIGDFDNDGNNDVFVVNGHTYPSVDGAVLRTTYAQRNQVLWNDGGPRLVEREISPQDGLANVRSSRGAAFGDIDNDGDLDVIIVNIDDLPDVLRNEQGTSNHWVAFALVGKHSNRNAIGARVTVTTASRTLVGEVRPSGSYLSSSDRRVHFGLGATDHIDRVVVRWPDGRQEEIVDVVVDRVYRLLER